MKSILAAGILLIIFLGFADAQSRSELEEKRKKALDEISYVDNLLKETEKQRMTSLNELGIIGQKLNLRESVLSGLREEINLLSGRVALNTIAIDVMESDLRILKNDYAKAVLNSYKTSKGNSQIFYVLSARDFNQGYKRLKYLQQITKFRRNESETIIELKSEIEESRKNLEQDLDRVSDLKSREEQQKNLLQEEKKSSRIW